MAKKKPKPAEIVAPAPPLRLEWRSPAELAENPVNWRRHPESQTTALGDVLSEVGWAGACLFNETTGHLIDGHARRKVALEQGCEKVPVLVGAWDEATEKKILATLDPLAAMAEADTAALDALLRDVQTSSQAVGDMLTKLAEETKIVPDGVQPSEEYPEIGTTTTHTVIVRYSDDDEQAIKDFVGQEGNGPLDPTRGGKLILERIKEIVATGADLEHSGEDDP